MLIVSVLKKQLCFGDKQEGTVHISKATHRARYSVLGLGCRTYSAAIHFRIFRRQPKNESGSYMQLTVSCKDTPRVLFNMQQVNKIP